MILPLRFVKITQILLAIHLACLWHWLLGAFCVSVKRHALPVATRGKRARSSMVKYGKPFGFLFSISRYRELFSDIGNSNSRYRKILSDIGKWWIKTQMAFNSEALEWTWNLFHFSAPALSGSMWYSPHQSISYVWLKRHIAIIIAYNSARGIYWFLPSWYNENALLKNNHLLN